MSANTSSTQPPDISTEPATSGVPPTTATSDLPTSGETGTDSTDGEDNTGESSGSSYGADETTWAPPRCGDGHVDPGEECDMGDLFNDENGACDLMCVKAKCGDGRIWTDVEACDDGPNNNDTAYGGCTTECKEGPRCGDNIRQAMNAEECDLGDGNGTGATDRNGTACDETCRYDAKIAFISSMYYQGWSLGGVAGADAACQSLAKAEGLDNATGFKAWISDPDHSPVQDFTHSVKPYVSRHGTLVAADWTALVQDGPGLDGIIFTEKGKKLLDARVWTATGPTGALADAANHCGAWGIKEKLPAAKARVGRSGLDKVEQKDAWDQWFQGKQWTNATDAPCETQNYLYCFEQ